MFTVIKNVNCILPEVGMICDDLHHALTVAVVIVFTRHTVVVVLVRAERLDLQIQSSELKFGSN